MSTDVEYLMKPRYKVIALWPFSDKKIVVGDIFLFDELRDCFYIKGTALLKDIPERYPHLLKKLEWYADRELSELPKYVKIVQYHPSYGEIKLNSIRPVTEWYPTKNNTSWGCDSFPVYLRINDLDPATEEQYLNQNKQL